MAETSLDKGLKGLYTPEFSCSEKRTERETDNSLLSAPGFENRMTALSSDILFGNGRP